MRLRGVTPFPRQLRFVTIGVTSLGLIQLLTACAGVQSALDPAGKDAEVLADLFWVLLIGAVVLWVLVNGFIFYITRIDRQKLSRGMGETLIIGGGIVFPLVALGILLTYALSIMPDHRAPGAGLEIRVTGKQWWWRVEYWPEGASEPIVSANEIRLPVGKRTEIRLAADEVIHSFWVPALAGKMDMIPGRVTRLALEPFRTGTFRGQCAEFCGPSHALMAFNTVVMEPAEFNTWLEKESRQAAEPSDTRSMSGKDAFFRHGCGACHAVRGTPARSQVGPDLTHIGSRTSIAAGTLPPTGAAMEKWISHPSVLKPNAKMPSFSHLSGDELAVLGYYLEGLK